MKSLRSGLAALLLAGVCSVGLVISTSRPAEALSVVDITKPAKALLGSPVTKTAGKGVSTFGLSSNPAGWAIRAGMFAWMAYSNRDAIVDFLNWGPDTPKTLNQWAALSGDKRVLPAAAADTNSQAWIENVTGRTFNVRFKCKPGPVGPPDGGNPPNRLYYCQGAGSDGTRPTVFSPNQTYYTGTTDNPKVWCLASGASAAVARTIDFADIRINGAFINSYPAEKTLTVTGCNSGETVQGVRIPAPNNVPSTANYQSYGIGYGYQGQGSFPAGNVTFGSVLVTARCINTKTGDTAVIPYRSALSADDQQMAIPSCKEQLGDDWRARGYTVAPEKPEIDNKPIPNEIEVPDFLPLDWDELIPDDGAENDPGPCKKTKDGCSLGVWIDNNPCTTGTGVCTKWRDIYDDQPNRIRCKWGIANVPIKNCLPLDYSRPESDLENKTEVPPKNGTGTSTGTSTAPVETADKPAQTKCFPKGWGVFNPFEWVYKPVKCAIQWAFEPQVDFKIRLNRMKAKLDNKAPFKWFAGISALATAVAPGDCPNWVLKTPGGQSKNIICGTPFGNAMHSFRYVLIPMMVGAAYWPLVRSVFYASFPIVKPAPSD